MWCENMSDSVFKNQVAAIVSITVDSRYIDFGYLEQPLISKRKSDPCFYIEI